MTEEEKKAIEKIKELEKLTREESKERNLKETQKLYKEYADYYLIILNLIEKLQKENENLKIDLEKANASIVDQTDKDNEIEHLENLLRGNLYDGYLYYKDIAREYQKNYALIEELKNKVAKRNNELIELEETSEKEFITKQEVKDNYIPKDKIREKIKEKEAEKQGVKNISLEEYAITSKELKESEICLLKCLLEEEYKNE